MDAESAPLEKVYLVGIAGVGMSALAHLLLSRGVQVAGSDPKENESTERLRAAGATIYHEQMIENIEAEKPDLVVATAAVAVDHQEVAAARRLRIPVESRAEFLGRMMAE